MRAVVSGLAALLLLATGTGVGAQSASGTASTIDVEATDGGGTLIQLADPLDEP